MKRYFKYIFLLFLFFSLKNVYAVELGVCSSDCPYDNLESLFSDIQRGMFSNEEYVGIILFDNMDYSISRDYSFDIEIKIYGPSARNFNFNGNHHTITSNNYVVFNAMQNLNLQNTSFIFQENNDIMSDVETPFDLSYLMINSKDASLENISIKYDGTISLEETNGASISGLYINSYNTSITNSSISRFPVGIYNYSGVISNVMRRIQDPIGNKPSPYVYELDRIEDVLYIPNVTIDSCDLADNVLSISGVFNAAISNSRVSSAYASSARVVEYDESNGSAKNTYMKFEDSNDYGNYKIKRINIADFPNSEEGLNQLMDISEDLYNHSYLVFMNGQASTIDLFVKKKDTINIQNLKKTNLLDYFVNIDEINIRSFTFTVSDPSIAVVEDGEVVFLKAGEVDVVATNQNTGEVYTVHFKLENPKTSSNPKTINSLYIMFGLLILMFVITSSMFMKKRNF